MISGGKTFGTADAPLKPVIPEAIIKNPKAVVWKISRLFNFNLESSDKLQCKFPIA